MPTFFLFYIVLYLFNVMLGLKLNGALQSAAHEDLKFEHFISQDIKLSMKKCNFEIANLPKDLDLNIIESNKVNDNEIAGYMIEIEGKGQEFMNHLQLGQNIKIPIYDSRQYDIATSILKNCATEGIASLIYCDIQSDLLSNSPHNKPQIVMSLIKELSKVVPNFLNEYVFELEKFRHLKSPASIYAEINTLAHIMSEIYTESCDVIAQEFETPGGSSLNLFLEFTNAALAKDRVIQSMELLINKGFPLEPFVAKNRFNLMLEAFSPINKQMINLFINHENPYIKLAGLYGLAGSTHDKGLSDFCAAEIERLDHEIESNLMNRISKISRETGVSLQIKSIASDLSINDPFRILKQNAYIFAYNPKDDKLMLFYPATITVIAGMEALLGSIQSKIEHELSDVPIIAKVHVESELDNMV